MNNTASYAPDRLAALEADITRARAAILVFASRMVEAGHVTVTSPMLPDMSERRFAIYDDEVEGYGVIFLSVVDGVSEVSTINFDFDDHNALRHIVHEDGNGVTFMSTTNQVLCRYRIDG